MPDIEVYPLNNINDPIISELTKTQKEIDELSQF